jgi:hypothetical protein
VKIIRPSRPKSRFCPIFGRYGRLFPNSLTHALLGPNYITLCILLLGVGNWRPRRPELKGQVVIRPGRQPDQPLAH